MLTLVQIDILDVGSAAVEFSALRAAGAGAGADYRRVEVLVQVRGLPEDEEEVRFLGDDAIWSGEGWGPGVVGGGAAGPGQAAVDQGGKTAAQEAEGGGDDFFDEFIQRDSPETRASSSSNNSKGGERKRRDPISSSSTSLSDYEVDDDSYHRLGGAVRANIWVALPHQCGDEHSLMMSGDWYQTMRGGFQMVSDKHRRRVESFLVAPGQEERRYDPVVRRLLSKAELSLRLRFGEGRPPGRTPAGPPRKKLPAHIVDAYWIALLPDDVRKNGTYSTIRKLSKISKKPLRTGSVQGNVMIRSRFVLYIYPMACRRLM